MFLLLEQGVIVDQNLKIFPLLNRLGFLNNQQYYNFKKSRTKKFNHLKDRFKIINIDQQVFFQDNMLHYGALSTVQRPTSYVNLL